MWEDLNWEDINLKRLNWEDLKQKGATLPYSGPQGRGPFSYSALH